LKSIRAVSKPRNSETNLNATGSSSKNGSSWMYHWTRGDRKREEEAVLKEQSKEEVQALETDIDVCVCVCGGWVG
jgi:hypothetical protein